MVPSRPRAGLAHPDWVVASLKCCRMCPRKALGRLSWYSLLVRVRDEVAVLRPAFWGLCLLVPCPIHRPEHAANRQRRQKQKRYGEGWDVGGDVSMGSVAPACLLQGLLLRGRYFTADQEVPGSAPGASGREEDKGCRQGDFTVSLGTRYSVELSPMAAACSTAGSPKGERAP